MAPGPIPVETEISRSDLPGNRDCIIVLAHRMDPTVRSLLSNLAFSDDQSRDYYICWDSAAGDAPALRTIEPFKVFTFDSREFSLLGFKTFGPEMSPGHNHFPILLFTQYYKKYEYYWVIEYDVAYTGLWSEFFDELRYIDAEFMTCHIRKWHHEPDWFWWGSLCHPTERIHKYELQRSLAVLYRISRNGVVALRQWHLNGWQGHFEVLAPTLFSKYGHRVVDLGGIGPAVPSKLKGKYYTSYSDRGGSLKWLGSVRFRPSMERPGKRRNFLYHPVKHSYSDTTSAFALSIAALKWLLAVLRVNAWKCQSMLLRLTGRL